MTIDLIFILAVLLSALMGWCVGGIVKDIFKIFKNHGTLKLPNGGLAGTMEQADKEWNEFGFILVRDLIIGTVLVLIIGAYVMPLETVTDCWSPYADTENRVFYYPDNVTLCEYAPGMPKPDFFGDMGGLLSLKNASIANASIFPYEYKKPVSMSLFEQIVRYRHRQMRVVA